MVRTATNRETLRLGTAPRRPSIKESTPTPRSVAVLGEPSAGLALSEPPGAGIRLVAGGGRTGGRGASASGSGGTAPSSSTSSKPKESPYYPSSIGMFFPFGSASSSSSSSAAETSRKTPFAPLGRSQVPPETGVGGASIVPPPPSHPGLATSKPLYYPGSSQGPARDREEDEARERGAVPATSSSSASSSTLQSLLEALEDDAGLDDYPNLVRYGDLPLLPVEGSDPARPDSPSSTALPRSSFRVSGSAPLRTILARIATFLKLQSVTCDPKGLVRDGDGVLACVTRRHCQFAIMMWRLEEGEDEEVTEASAERGGGDDAPAGTSRAVLIAIERRQGCCVELQRMRQALKKAIETGRFESASDGASAAAVGCHQAFKGNVGSRTIAPMVKKLYRRQMRGEAAGAEPDSAPSPPDDVSSQPSSSSRSSVRRRSSLDGISTCATLLASQCLYKQQLGLENLVALTDPNGGGVDLETAMDVTDALLQNTDPVPAGAFADGGSRDSDSESENDDEDELFKRLQHEFTSFFVNPEDSFHDVTQSQAFSLAMSSGSSAPRAFPDLTESPLQRTIRHSLALEALCNALQVTKKSAAAGPSDASSLEGNAAKVTDRGGSGGGNDDDDDESDRHEPTGLDLRSDFWRVVIPALLMDVANARSRPHDAALSAKCLALLQDLHRHSEGGDSGDPASSSHRQAGCFMCLDYIESLLPYLVQARTFGSRHHLLLEREANELIGRLQRDRRHDDVPPRGLPQPSPPQLQTS